MPFLDKLLKYFESEAAIIDTQFMTDPREIPGCECFKSCIRFNGESILPPLVRIQIMLHMYCVIITTFVMGSALILSLETITFKSERFVATLNMQ